ncbi:hypothetical protein ACOMHN_021839 [Nucella lapillus]
MDFGSNNSARHFTRSKTSRRSSSSSSSNNNNIASNHPRRLVRAVLGVIFFLSLSTSAAPVPRTVLGQIEPYVVDPDDSSEAVSMLTFLRSLLSSARFHKTSSADEYDGEDDISEVKRGFGIAGLDNVDMITSTLDRSRAMSRARHGRRYLTSGLTYKQLRALMERAG